MTFVEQMWFETTFADKDMVEYYKTEGDRDADFRNLDDTSVEKVFDQYVHATNTSRSLGAGHDLDEMAKRPRRGRESDLRWILPSHDRGVRAPLRSRRLDPGVGRRSNRVLGRRLLPR